MSKELDYQAGPDFAALAAKAQHFEDAAITNDKVDLEKSEETTLTQEQSDLSSNEQQVESQGKVLELTDDALVRVKIDGEIQEVPYKEFKDSLQREAAWHKKNQEFAKGRKETEELFIRQYAELESAARQLKAYEQGLAQKYGQLQTQHQQATTVQQKEQIRDEIATLSEVRQEAERLGQTIEQKIAARDQQINRQIVEAAKQVKQEFEQQKEMNRFTQMLNKNVLENDQYQVLKEVIPNFEQNLRWAVVQLGPQSLEEGAEYAVTIANDWASKFKSKIAATQQRADDKKAKALLEPSDGSPIPPKNAQKQQKQSFIGKDGKWDHKALREAASRLLD
jgi:hypothetical protein